LYQPQVIDDDVCECEAVGGMMIIVRETEVLGENHFAHHKSYMT
jgi:hypothetical protein